MAVWEMVIWPPGVRVCVPMIKAESLLAVMGWSPIETTAGPVVWTGSTALERT